MWLFIPHLRMLWAAMQGFASLQPIRRARVAILPCFQEHREQAGASETDPVVTSLAQAELQASLLAAKLPKPAVRAVVIGYAPAFRLTMLDAKALLPTLLLTLYSLVYLLLLLSFSTSF